MEIKHIFIKTYGCTANQNNSEIIKAKLVEAGLDIVENEKLADIYIVNTCIVKGPTENKVIRKIQDLLKTKKPVIVTGCIVLVRKKYLENLGVYLLSLNNLNQVSKLIRKISERNYLSSDFISKQNQIKLGSKIRKNKFIGITQISEGCLNSCSFCITRLAKGKLFSFPENKILENIKKDLNSGCKEIQITSQDNASYDLDNKKRNLCSLLNKILKINKRFKLRIGMMNPENTLFILDDLIEIYKNNKIYKFLHLPLQSGSDKILKIMNRKYSVSDFLKIIKKFKKHFPEITIATDIIVGFPGETPNDFKKTLNIIKKIKPDVLNISKFWPKKRTQAALMPQINSKIRKKRATKLMNLHREIALNNKKNLLNSKAKVLFLEKQGQIYLGRNESYQIIIVMSKENLLGKIKKIKITKIKPHYMYGSLIKPTNN